MSDDTVTITVDGQELQAPAGSMLIEATDRAGINVPRFCYHKKLSVAANCRMCLVEVEKAPKPLPACATPVMGGMVVHTRSELAIEAQESVMEFLLINHPLDCPICDQGGECELQDVAMGYGNDISKYTETKRVVFDRDIGPLIATDLTRCIHCTRCVRFGEEIAGLRELGMTGRSEDARIATCVEQTVSSEMSGNVIDLCPVGALTAKPSRFAARAWEMVEHSGIAPHDCVGSNIYLHTLRNQVVRVVPRDNEDINEAWLSDRDRFSYEGLYSKQRLEKPMVKVNGIWNETDWDKAFDSVVNSLKATLDASGADEIAVLASSTSTLEELHLLQKLMRGLGIAHIDHRLHQQDFSDDETSSVMPWMGMPVHSFEKLDAGLFIGSNTRKEQPIIAHRLRKAVIGNAAKLSFVNPRDFDFRFPLHRNIVVSPAGMLNELASLAKAAYEQSGESIPGHLADVLTAANVSEDHKSVIESLKSADNSCVMTGNLAVYHDQYSVIRVLAQVIAVQTASTLGCLPEHNNTAGAWLAGVVPHRNAGGVDASVAGDNASQVIDKPRRAYILFNVEPEHDCAHSARALAAMNQADLVIAFCSFASETMKSYASILLPIASFAETSGTYVNGEGYWQSFKGACPPPGDARPGWKVLRVLGNKMDQKGFDYTASIQVRDELKALCQDVKLDNATTTNVAIKINSKATLQRAGDVPIYACDMLVRQAPSLQKTADAEGAKVYLCQQDADKYGVSSANKVKVVQDDASVTLPLVIDNTIPEGCAWIPAALKNSTGLGHVFGPVEIKKT